MDAETRSPNETRRPPRRWASVLVSAALVASSAIVLPALNATPAYASAFSPMQELQALLDQPGDQTVTLDADIVAGSGEGLVVPRDSSVKTLDLNGFSLTINDPGRDAAAVGVRTNAALIVTDTSADADGRLTASGGEAAAGIGGSAARAAGSITIAGGTVTATGGVSGAGIGGGWQGPAGEITVSGGDVTATGGRDAAGIGGGRSVSGGTVTVSGGSVTAHGGSHGAGIGGGGNAPGGNVTVSDGTVTATGGDFGAGIGGGAHNAGGFLSVSGGVIIAAGGAVAAGIGGGDAGAGSQVTVSGGHITAIGGGGYDTLSGSAIGSGAVGNLAGLEGGTILYQGYAPTPVPALPTNYSVIERDRAQVAVVTSDESTARTWNYTEVVNATSALRAKVVIEWSESPDTPLEEAEAPGVPTDLALVAGDQEVALTWGAPSDDGGSAVTGYFVDYRKSASGTWTTVAPASRVNSFTVGGLTNGVKYDFRVSAVNMIGEGEPSAVASATPTPDPTPADDTTPGTPTNLALVAGDQEVALTWGAPSDDGGSAVTGYYVDYRESASGTWTTVAPAALVNSFTVGGLTNGVKYDFRVSAVNMIGEGEPSAVASATPAAAPTPDPTPADDTTPGNATSGTLPETGTEMPLPLAALGMFMILAAGVLIAVARRRAIQQK